MTEPPDQPANPVDRHGRRVYVWRAALGLLLGVIIGLVTWGLLDTYYELAFPAWGAAAIASIVCASLAAMVGRVHVSGAVMSTVIGGIIGLAVGGAVIGFLVYPRIMMRHVDPSVLGFWKYYSSYQYQGFAVGAPAGTIVGVMVGLCGHALRRRSRKGPQNVGATQEIPGK